MNRVFKNAFGELRAGWQIALFLVALAITTGAIVAPLVLLGITDTMSLSAAALAGTLLATFVVTRFVNRKPLVAVGLAVKKHTMRELGVGCLIGWLMMTGIFGIEYVQGYVKVEAVELTFMQGVELFITASLFFCVAAMFEEVLFRGYLFQTLMRGIKFIPAVIAVGLFFGFAHIRNPNAQVVGVLNTVLVSVLFCFAYWRTRGLWLPFGIHFAWNFAQTTLYGFPTSGKHFSEYELTRLTQFGPEWITGGAYGPEGGVLATLMIVLCGAYVYFSRSLKPLEGTVTLEREDEDLQADMLERRKAA
jgi:membrane protease YdiL (CAAX protease family)